MLRSSTSFEIARSSGRCAATGRELSPGEPCIAVLCERADDDGFERLDYSVDAWASGTRPQRLFSYWKTTTPHPHGKKRVFVDDDMLRNLFERLADDDRPQRVAFRFVIALVLMRKRLLRYVGCREEDGIERWTLQWKGAAPDDVVTLVNPGLADDDVRAVSDQLSEILNGELE